jgi:hypothetical protein
VRTKTLTTAQLKPGMVIESVAYDRDGNLLTKTLRVVADNRKTTPWAERCITFADGTYLMLSLRWEHAVIRSKSVRSAAKARTVAAPSFTFADALNLLGAYAANSVTP